MKTFAELDSLNLVWLNVKGRSFQLRSVPEGVDPRHVSPNDGELIATLKRSYWSSRAEVDAVGNRWTFERKIRFFKPTTIVIRSVGTGEEPAAFEQKWNGGTLTYADGRVFHWRTEGILQQRYIWTSDDGTPLLGFEMKGIFKVRGAISINSELEDHVDPHKAPPMLVFLGWYLILLAQDDAAAVVVAGS